MTCSLSFALTLLSLFLSRHGSTLPTRWTLLCRGADPLHLDSTCQRCIGDANGDARLLVRAPNLQVEVSRRRARGRFNRSTRFYAERERGRDVARIVFAVDGNAVLFNRARINNWQQAHVDFRTVASASYACVVRATRGAQSRANRARDWLD